MLPRCRMAASTAQTVVTSSGHKPSACRAFTSPVKSWASSLPWSLQARPCRAQHGWQQGLAPQPCSTPALPQTTPYQAPSLGRPCLLHYVDPAPTWLR